ncbi:DUF2071 domain-containing protein [Nocardioides sp. SYSU DS0663]|uniref:DUF2071 domain-containing protein n=1 Tax=Nocardioides sp. SYSU DS0663 TaxID=3416445 RepID=UPI003F4B9E2C
MRTTSDGGRVVRAAGGTAGRLPRIASEIERRLLVNYRVDPEVAAGLLPPGFRPQTVDGHAMAGICLIRLGSVRPAALPARLGIGSENAAHRFSVEWDRPDGSVGTGVYVPRRDSDAWANVLLGGRLFPGVHHHARFDVDEDARRLHVGFTADDGSAAVEVEVALRDAGAAGPGPEAFASEVFGTVAEASAFFEAGALGWSPTRREGRLEALELRTSAWRVAPVDVVAARSTYFEDTSVFPTGSAVLDHALVMREVPVTWTVPR